MALIRSCATWITICGQRHIFVYNNDSRLLKLHHHIDISDVCTAKSKEDNDENDNAESRHESLSAAIVDASFSQNDKLFAVVTTSKHLIVYNIEESWMKDCLCVRHLTKAPTRVLFDAESCVLVSDRAGSLRKFFVDKDETVELLGHVSMLLDFSFSHNEQRVYTVDRDEKLRVSRYPQTFVIEAFGLGHRTFINSVVNLPGDVAATAGGDSTIRLWNTETGECIFETAKLINRPIRKLCLRSGTSGTKLFVLAEDSDTLLCFDYDAASTSLGSDPMLSQQPVDVFVDVTCDNSTDTVLCLGRQGVYSAKCSDTAAGALQKIDVENASQLFAIVECAKDAFPLSQLYKVTGFENMKTYTERKAWKLQRKRKLGAENNNNANNECVSKAPLTE